MDALVVCAHPDDEVIFFAPVISEKFKLEGVRVICMTCRNHPVRAQEFDAFCSAASISGQILDNEIRRSVQFSFVRRVYRALDQGDREKPFLVIFTHSCFGDDHFHPQHVSVFLGALLYAIARRKPLVVHDFIFRTDMAAVRQLGLCPLEWRRHPANVQVFRQDCTLRSAKAGLQAEAGQRGAREYLPNCVRKLPDSRSHICLFRKATVAL